MQPENRHVYTKEFILSLRHTGSKPSEEFIESLGQVALQAPPLHAPQPPNSPPPDSVAFPSVASSKAPSRAILIPGRSHPFGSGNQTNSLPKSNFQPSSLPSTSHMSFGRGYDSLQAQNASSRRRSPSPPIRALSSSPPPGFGKLPTLPRSSPNTIRDAFRSRIAKGPDLSANFQTRIKYHEKTSTSSKQPTVKSEEPSSVSNPDDLWKPIEDTTTKNDSEIANSPPSSQIPDEIERLFTSSDEPRAQPPLPTTVTTDYHVGEDHADNKSEHNEDPFDAFARSLAALASKPEETQTDTKEKEPGHEGHNGIAHFSDFRNRSTNHHDDEPTEKVQGDMDALSQWFGNIAASASTDTSTATNVTVVESSQKETSSFQSMRQAPVELDPNVVAYFASIRSQAIDERNWELVPSLSTDILLSEEKSPSLASKSFPMRESPVQRFPSMHDYRSLHEDEQRSSRHDLNEGVREQAPEKPYTHQQVTSTERQNRSSDTSAFGNLEQWFSALAVAEEMKPSQ